MREWKVGKQFEYEGCPVTARHGEVTTHGGTEVTVSAEEVVVEENGIGGCYCCGESTSTVCIPIAVMIAVMEANGFTVTRK